VLKGRILRRLTGIHAPESSSKCKNLFLPEERLSLSPPPPPLETSENKPKKEAKCSSVETTIL